MVCVPLLMASVLDVAVYRSRVQEQELKAELPMQKPGTVSVVVQAKVTADQDKPPCP
jgi:hypothetical protein